MPNSGWKKKYNTPGKRRAHKAPATKIQAIFRRHRTMKGPLVEKSYKYPMFNGKAYKKKTFLLRDRNKGRVSPNEIARARKRGKENYWKFYHKSKNYGRTASLFLPLPETATEEIYNYI
jgi:hypothetical protein